MEKGFSRRDFIRAGGLTLLGAAGVAALTQTTQQAGAAPPSQEGYEGGHEDMAEMHQMPSTVGEVDHVGNGFNTTDILTDFDYGELSEMDDGQPLREYNVVSVDKSFELVPGIEFPGWAFNGRIPGPTFRCTEGDR